MKCLPLSSLEGEREKETEGNWPCEGSGPKRGFLQSLGGHLQGAKEEGAELEGQHLDTGGQTAVCPEMIRKDALPPQKGGWGMGGADIPGEREYSCHRAERTNHLRNDTSTVRSVVNLMCPKASERLTLQQRSNTCMGSLSKKNERKGAHLQAWINIDVDFKNTKIAIRCTTKKKKSHSEIQNQK